MGNNKKKRTVLQRWLRGRKVHPIQGRTALRSTVLMRPDDHRTYRYAKKRRDWKFFSRVPKGHQEHSNFIAEGLVAPKNEKEALSTHRARASSATIPSRVEAMRNPRRHRRKRVLLLLMVGLLILLLGYSYYDSNQRFRVTEYTVESERLPNALNGTKIVQISDLHGKIFGKENKKLLQAVEEQQPDLIVVTGDLFSQDATKETQLWMRATLYHLQQIAPTYYIVGNHEEMAEAAGQTDPALEEQLARAGVTWLQNRTVIWKKNGEELVLVGLREGLQPYKDRPDHLSVKEILGDKTTEQYTILLAHNAIYAEDYANWGADLTLSGHVHGGGWRIPGGTGIFSPDGTWFPRYDHGEYRFGARSVIVSSGLGNSGLPFRLFNPPELVVIHLQSKSIH